ncbi:DUF418 domain-containing protein [Evansella sp. AB-rgal1]|uniref:DUF418 domain-containing protein n=1 Tax=Evansella sp. AB-rgal1 TaxID=3242696 RepID=UPI00359EDC8A
MSQKNSKNTKVNDLTPIDSESRLNHIDSLRGFALLGILLVNMLAFQYGIFGQEFIYPDLIAHDQGTYFIIQWLLQGSFYPIFSIMFGFGAVIMWERATAKQRPFNLVFIRRLLILLVIGFFHLYFIWDGDILMTYAIAGFLFIFFIKRHVKTIAIWFISLVLLMNAPMLIPDEEGTDYLHLDKYGEYEQSILAEGSYQEIFTHRLTANPFQKAELAENVSEVELTAILFVMSAVNTIMTIVQAFVLFLLGGIIAKKRWLHQLNQSTSFLVKTAIIATVTGVVIKLGFVLSDNINVTQFSYLVGGPILSIGYISTFAVLYQKLANHKQIFDGFAFVGRMALTNYLTQSIVMTTFFYGYGLGLLGKLGTFLGTILAIALFVVQIFMSKWWLRRYNHGPMEAFWRTGTYLNVQKMKK